MGELYYLLDEEKGRKNKQNTLLLSIFPHNRNSLLMILASTDCLTKNAWYKGSSNNLPNLPYTGTLMLYLCKDNKYTITRKGEDNNHSP